MVCTLFNTTSHPQSVTKGRDNNFNFLRLLFSVLVLVSHSPEQIDGNRKREVLTRLFGTISFGDLAVDGFFLLSGYLIVKSWQQKQQIMDFFNKRIRRIFPGYLAAFLISIFFLGPFGVDNVATYFSDLSASSLIVSALQLQKPLVKNVFPGTHYADLNGAMWSIAYEFRCYVLVALIGLIGAKWQKIIWLILFILFLIFSLLPKSLISALHFPGISYLIDDPLKFARLFAFFCGGACFYLYNNKITWNRKLVVIATLALLPLMFHPQFVNIGLATLGAYLLFWIAFAKLPSLNKFQSMRDISYGLYLYGWPIQKLLNWYFPLASPWLLLLPALISSSIAGLASWHFVESRFIVKSPDKIVGFPTK